MTSSDMESTDEEVLLAIQHDHPVVPRLLQYKELSKLRGTYVRPMPRLARHVGFNEWRMYPNFTTTRIPSGRYACRAPNLLAMPARTERGRDVKRGFITKPGWVYVSVDLSQIEPRIAAHRSKDPALLRIYHNEEDIYSDFATSAYKLPDKRYKATGEEEAKLRAKKKSLWVYPTVESGQRTAAKICVLAWFYKVTASGLLAQFPIICANCGKEATKHENSCSKFVAYWTENKCQDLINSAGITYPGVIRMQIREDKYAQQKAYHVDGWGRILHVAAVRSIHQYVVTGALREVGNFGQQATAAGCLKLSMAEIQDQIEDGGLSDLVHPLLMIHDELLFEVREDIAEDFAYSVVVPVFENCVRLDVPIKAGVATADSWGTIQK